MLLAFAASSASAEQIKLKFAASHLNVLERQLRSYGFDCPRVQAADLSQIRMIVGGSGHYRAEPWIEERNPGALAGAVQLKASLQ